MIRRTVLFSGTVQGVGFRFAVSQAVGDATVTGYVRNLPDGRVEAVFEGKAETIDAVLDRVRAKMAANIEHESAVDEPPQGGMSGFRIKA